jgi:thiamine transport system ATP-binding protein
MTTLEVARVSGPARAGVPLDAVSFTVADGSIAAIYGDAHSGKRTLLRVIAGLEPAENGADVVLGDSSVAHHPVHRRRIGTVLRDAVMLPGSVRDNVLFGLKQQKWPRDDRDRRAAEMLELVGLTGAEDDVASSLSEDERARVALARALAPRPAVLLFEAPTATIDEVLKADYRTRLREILRSIPLTTVIFTDDLRDAVGMADDLHVMTGGRIAQSGALSRVLSGPNSIEVAQLVGYVTLVRGEVDGAWILESNAGAIAFPAGYPLKGVARALAHPSTMLGVPESSGLGCGVSGMIERIRAVGPTYLLDLRVGDRLIEVRWEWDVAPPPRDQPIGIAVTPNTLRFFNEPVSPQPAPRDTRIPQAEAPSAGATPSDDPEVALEDAVAADEPVDDGEPFPSTSDDEPEVVDEAEIVVPNLTSDEPNALDDDLEVPETPDANAMPSVAAMLDEDVESMARPAPAPAPPRTIPPAYAPIPTPARRHEPGASTTGEPADDPSKGDAPWTQASSPASPKRPSPPSADDRDDRHRGMPLD